MKTIRHRSDRKKQDIRFVENAFQKHDMLIRKRVKIVDDVQQ